MDYSTNLQLRTLGILYGRSDNASAEQRFKHLFDKNQRFADTFELPGEAPAMADGARISISSLANSNSRVARPFLL
jgi:hypothetical protein